MIPDTVCLPGAYLAPIEYYSVMVAYSHVLIELHEHYVKQTIRNRMYIASENGPLALVVPIEHSSGEKKKICDIRISDHGNWPHLHWQALRSAYDKSPFFEYYADDFSELYNAPAGRFLLDFNLELQDIVCSLLAIKPNVSLTEQYEKSGNFIDLRGGFDKKSCCTKCIPYYQVFGHRLGFIANLSIVDLLFNMGPEALLVLRDSIEIPKKEEG